MSLALLAVLFTLGVKVGNITGCYYGDVIINIPCSIFELSIVILIAIIIFEVYVDFILPKIKEKKRIEKESKATRETSPKIRHQRFVWRAFHAEYRVNANAETVFKYLLQHYTGIAIYSDYENITYVTQGVTSIDPNNSNETFQYGFIVNGIKETGGKPEKFLSGSIRPLSSIESINEMFFVTVTQSADNVSIVSFDTDSKGIASFSEGLLKELKKGFTVKILKSILNSKR